MGNQAPLSPRAKTRLTLLFLLLLFVIPIIIVQIALSRGWLEQGPATTNKGQRITSPVALVQLGLPLDDAAISNANIAGAWWLVYIAPEHCEAACQNSLYQMGEATRGASHRLGQVRQLLITPHKQDDRLRQLLDDGGFADLHQVDGNPRALDNALAKVVEGAEPASQAGYLYLMNPRGDIMMYYPPVEDETASRLMAEDIRSDLERLL